MNDLKKLSQKCKLNEEIKNLSQRNG